MRLLFLISRGRFWLLISKKLLDNKHASCYSVIGYAKICHHSHILRFVTFGFHNMEPSRFWWSLSVFRFSKSSKNSILLQNALLLWPRDHSAVFRSLLLCGTLAAKPSDVRRCTLPNKVDLVIRGSHKPSNAVTIEDRICEGKFWNSIGLPDIDCSPLPSRKYSLRRFT